jgi:hypothetical protein
MPRTGPLPTASRSRVSQPGRGRADRLARLEERSSQPVALVGRVHRGTDHAPALREQQLDVVDHPLTGRRGVGEERHVVALLAAEQLVDRHAERLALDVVQGDVDRRDRGREDAAALEVVRPVHLLPQRADVHRVLADQELAEVPDRGRDGLLAAREPRLAPADDPLVGLDLDDQLVALADEGRTARDLADLHPATSRAGSYRLVGGGPPPGQ